MKNLDFPQAHLWSGGGGGGEEADRASLERLWGDEVYDDEGENDDGGSNGEEGEIGNSDDDDDDDGVDYKELLRKEFTNLTLRVKSADEEVLTKGHEAILISGLSFRLLSSWQKPSPSWPNS